MLLSALTCGALVLACVFTATSADAILSPMPTVADRKLLETYEAAGGALSFVDLVCLSGVVMLTLTFFERTGRAPIAADRASDLCGSEALLQELGIQSNAAGAAIFAKQCIAHWLQQVSWRDPRTYANFQQQLVEMGFDAEEAEKITFKLKELDWSKGNFEIASKGLARVRELFGAATLFFQAAVANAPGGVFTKAFFEELAEGLDDAREMGHIVRGGINRWQQFNIKSRLLQWQKLYKQSPQSFYESLLNSNNLVMCEFEASIFLRELGKLQVRVDSRHDLEDLKHVTHGQPDLPSDCEHHPQAAKFQFDAHGQLDLLDPQDSKLTTHS